jgi:hypothetical protein
MVMDREVNLRYFAAALFLAHVNYIGRNQRAHGSNRRFDGIACVWGVAPNSRMKDQSLHAPKGWSPTLGIASKVQTIGSPEWLSRRGVNFTENPNFRRGRNHDRSGKPGQFRAFCGAFLQMTTPRCYQPSIGRSQ